MKKSTWLLLLLVVVGCSETPPKPKKEPDWSQEKSSEMNKEFAVEEDLEIRLYLEQHKEYNPQITGSGLRYIPLKTTNGELAAPGRDAHVQYKVTFLDGEKVYETAADEVDIFRVDKSNIETGIQEGIKKMKVGERSILIIPSHLAHGLIGDMDKIPPLTTLVVDIELLKLE